MKTCNYCGNLILENENFCTACGARINDINKELNVNSNNKYSTCQRSNDRTLSKIALIFLVIACVLEGMIGILLLFTFPILSIIFIIFPCIISIVITSYISGKINNKEPISLGIKIVILILISRIAGILLLCEND